MPRFVVVIGGSGSGKNHYIATHPVYSRFVLVDADDVPVGKKPTNVKKRLAAVLSSGVDVAHPTTGASKIEHLVDKLSMAKKFGYETELVLIDTPPAIAAANVKERISGGGHGVGLDQWKIEATNLKARETFNLMKDDRALVDRAYIIQGRQNIPENKDHRILRQFIALFIE